MAPGGHWNDAYSFVRLHQPSAYYGVNSRKLGGDLRDASPLNLGMGERATSAEIISYYEAIMQEFLASDRVQYFPMCEYQEQGGVHSFKSLMHGQRREVTVHKRVVDTTYLNTSVPSTHPPKYAVEAGVKCMPLNDLPRVKKPPSGYVVVGAGKTGIDACLWLLENQVSPDAITWVMPRDSWFLNRANVQSGDEFFVKTFGALAAQMEAVNAAESVDDLFAKLEAADQLLRLDPTIKPGMYHAAVVSHAELVELRKIKHIVRLGRIKAIEKDCMILERGTVAMDADRLYVDCSASAAQIREIIPIFAGNKITPQFIRSFQPTFSAALVAHIEASYDDDAKKNALCGVVPLPDTPLSWLTMQAASMKNQYAWSREKGIGQWIAESRLDGFTAMVHRLQEEETEKVAVYERFVENLVPAVKKLPTLIASAQASA
jgi:hypothetical protein